MNNEEPTVELPEPTPDLSAAYPELEKLKAANEALREAGKDWLLTTLETICDEINQASAPPPVEPAAPAAEPRLQLGDQEWQFTVGDNVMVGERLGIRHKGQSLVVEVGWPRLPEHGIVPDLGLARARISFSQNIMIDARLLAELSLRRSKDSAEAHWHVLADHQVGEKITAEKLRAYVQLVLAE
ncbi:MAG TPA: hypothetical protein VFZ34_16465 [Blastocatellia bacterium]|nr:hypothetical protein [Blastocatellia bacterium]